MAGEAASRKTVSERRTVFSPDRVYRYTLWRDVPTTLPGLFTALRPPDRYVQFIGLNPSTADETRDDPTVRRCIDFAKRWGYGTMCMTNAFAYRATKPRVMMGQPRPIGDENDRWLATIARDADLIVAAWGKHGRHMGRDEELWKLLDGIHALAVNGDGTPQHPLYLPATTRPQPYESFSNALCHGW